MSPAFPARKRAEQFDAMVEGTAPITTFDPATRDLLQLVSSLRTAPRVSARPEFVLSLREQLMIAAETELVPGRTARDVKAQLVKPQRTGRERRLATALGGFALVGATASMAVAAQHALPGDQLYPMKRALENAHTNLSIGNDAKGSTLLANAKDRLDEVQALSQQDDASPEAISSTLNTFTDQATQASNLLIEAYHEDGDKGAISELAAFTTTSTSTLDDLVAVVPLDAQDALASASRTIDSIQQDAVTACPTCAVIIADAGAAVKDHPGAPTGPTVRLTAGPVRISVPPIVVPGHHVAPSVDAPTTTPSAPATALPPVLDPSDGPTAPTSSPTPPGLFPTPSSSSSSSSGTGSQSGDGSGGPLAPVTSAIGTGIVAGNSGTPLIPGVGAIVSSAADAAGGILGGITGSSASGTSASSSSPSPTASPSAHHTKHPHQKAKNKKSDSSKTDAAEQPSNPLDLLGD